jgi:hypothetical protein
MGEERQGAPGRGVANRPCRGSCRWWSSFCGRHRGPLTIRCSSFPAREQLLTAMVGGVVAVLVLSAVSSPPPSSPSPSSPPSSPWWLSSSSSSPSSSSSSFFPAVSVSISVHSLSSWSPFRCSLSPRRARSQVRLALAVPSLFSFFSSFSLGRRRHPSHPRSTLRAVACSGGSGCWVPVVPSLAPAITAVARHLPGVFPAPNGPLASHLDGEERFGGSGVSSQ